jgi:hypothetical protein
MEREQSTRVGGRYGMRVWGREGVEAVGDEVIDSVHYDSSALRVQSRRYSHGVLSICASHTIVCIGYILVCIIAYHLFSAITAASSSGVKSLTMLLNKNAKKSTRKFPGVSKHLYS